MTKLATIARRAAKTPRWRGAQAGAAAIVLLAILVMGALYGLIVSMNTATAELQRKREDATATALRRAKEALIAYAVTYSDTHPDQVIGYLPCPDDGTGAAEGQAVTPCGTARVSRLGRLPWRTLGIGPLRDSDGQCLWYAVSGTYKSNPMSGLMNWDTAGQFEVAGPDGVTLLAGTTAANRAVAVIFAPGAPRGAQNRSPTPGTVCGGDSANAAAYLDVAGLVDNAVVSGTAEAVTRFIAANPSDPSGTFTDRLIFITADEIWTAAKKRSDLQARLKALTEKVAQCVAQAANTNAPADLHLPWPARLDISAAGGYYALASFSDTVTPLRAGRLPKNFSNSAIASTADDLFDATCLTSSSDQNWYENWKDHFLYVVADEFKPSAAPTTACGATCLTVGAAGNFAGLVLFGGQRGAVQQRDTALNKDLVLNYLEAPNAANFQARYVAPGGPVAPFAYVRIATAPYPEFAYCIQPSGPGPTQVAGECP
jgi:hypothetical protein